MNIIAYTYDNDYHCIDCTIERYGIGKPKFNSAGYPIQDSNGIHIDSVDMNGGCTDGDDTIRQVLCTDEWWALQVIDESYFANNPIQHLVCGTCRVIIDDYHHEIGRYSVNFKACEDCEDL